MNHWNCCLTLYGIPLVSFWFLLITFVITSMLKVFPSPSTTLTNDLYTWMYVVLLILSLLVGPLTGWLADAKFGNYKVVRFGVWLLFLATVLNCFYHLIADNTSTLALRLLLFVIYILFFAGCVSSFLVLFQLGMDQMPDASSSSISSYITWFICSGVLGAYFGNFLYTLKLFCLQDVSWYSNYQQVWSLLLVLSLSCVLILDFCLSRKWLIIEPKSPNSLRTIYQVLKFAAKHKAPLNHSALTYWEEDIPSRGWTWESRDMVVHSLQSKLKM